MAWVAPTEGHAAELLALANAERARRGLAALAWDERLAERGRGWSNHMGARGELTHSELTPLLAHYAAAAENIATGTASTGGVHLAWMRSSGHRHNILAANVDVVGIGVVCVGGVMWATLVVARTEGSALPWGFGAVPPEQPIAASGSGGRKCE